MISTHPAVACNATVESPHISYREALHAVMHGALERNPHVIILGQGVDDHKGTFGSTLGLAERYGSDRVLDTPLAEEGITGIAIGAALNGLYPICTHIRADFFLLATNQIINLAAKYRYMFGGRFEVPMLVRLVVGRSWGQGAQHSQSLQALYAHIPGLTVIMPATAQSVLDCYPYIIERCRNPVVAIEHRLLYDLNFRTEPTGSPDRAGMNPLTSRKLRTGGDITIVATSIMALEAMRAAEYLAHHAGLDCEIIDLNCVSRPNEQLIVESIRKTGKLLVADTSWRAYGVCAEISRIVAESCIGLLKAPVVTVGMKPCPCPTGKALEDLFYPNLADLTDAIATLVLGTKTHRVPLPDERSMADVYKRFKGPF